MSSRRRGASKGKHLERRQHGHYFDGETGRLVLARLETREYDGGYFVRRRPKGTRKVR